MKDDESGPLPDPSGEPPGPQRSAAQRGGDGSEGQGRQASFTRRALLRAGWSIPAVLVAAQMSRFARAGPAPGHHHDHNDHGNHNDYNDHHHQDHVDQGHHGDHH